MDQVKIFRPNSQQPKDKILVIQNENIKEMKGAQNFQKLAKFSEDEIFTLDMRKKNDICEKPLPH